VLRLSYLIFVRKSPRLLFKLRENCYTIVYAMAKVIPTKPLFIMLYGLPGAGKTYFARQLCDNLQAAHVQSDRIRAELFENPRYDQQENAIVAQLMEYMTSEFLNAGVSVVYDTNVVRTSQRRTLREMARDAHAQSLLIWFQIDIESAYLRASKRDRRRADDRYAMPVDRTSFKKLAANMQNPVATEDYIVISGKHLFSTQLSALMKRLHELKLIATDDMSSHVIKPGMVNEVCGSVFGQMAACA